MRGKKRRWEKKKKEVRGRKAKKQSTKVGIEPAYGAPLYIFNV